MPTLPAPELARMRDQLFFDGENAGAKLSRFWVLLILAAIIATAGVISDSTATVIGAMIVAPLMTPILGSVLATVTSDAKNLLRSLALVIAGAAAVVAIGWAFGAIAPVDVVADTNSQVAARVHPRLIDLIAALATGAVGAFALARSDVSDTLPGVAIAISLVPPLAVVGLTLEAGATSQSFGALLLFLTNVAAILLSGLIVMALFQVSAIARSANLSRSSWGPRSAVLIVLVFVAIIAIPLATATFQLTEDRINTGTATTVAKDWASPAGWRILMVEYDDDGILVRAAGPLPAPSTEALRSALDDKGLDEFDVKLELVPQEDVLLPGR